MKIQSQSVLMLSLLYSGVEAFTAGIRHHSTATRYFTNAASVTAAAAVRGYSPKSTANTKAFVIDSRLRGGASSSSSLSSPFTSKTQLAAAAKEEVFPTWTFDNACTSAMESTPLSAATLSFTTDESVTSDADLLVIGIAAPPKEDTDDDEEEDKKKDEEDEEVPSPTLVGKAKELDEELGGALTDLLMEQYKDFKHGAKAGSTTSTLRIFDKDEKKTKRIVLMGLGAESKEDDDDKKDEKDTLFTTIGSTLATKCDSEKKVSTCTLLLPDTTTISSMKEGLSDLSTSFHTTLYSDNRYRTGDKVVTKSKDLASVSIVSEATTSDDDVDWNNEALTSGANMASGVYLAKDIVNAPHNVLNSESLAALAKQIAEESNGRITCKVLGKEECEERGMGAYLGVARGSETEPQFIHLTYTPESGEVKKKVGIVGKGLLFDTGGYNIKVAMMELMKFDCGGAAAVLGAARAVGKLAPDDVEAHFIVAACENMINDRAVVPSDILTASNGKTIEIINTDAEGRLTLADALVYADKEVGCESIIELSTLTGACMVSLGQKVCGVWTGDDKLADELKDVSKVTGDKSWRMPLVKEYNDQLKSKIADITNCGTRYGGAITAALFLENFVSKKVPFAHIDIAGPVWSDKDGATGFGAKMVTEWVSRQGKKE